ncbi:ATP-binding protein [Nocardioides sp. QY071]|uniref:ATP-binding protein n=1 Tax=Nocardioides sp. QY071 TaxID=3044187 RepID=UPI00249ABF7B|nr:ATP-binding protein [Nocardioides sp. QY071]WGY01810.1 ATP-binding protein [Nocardioides sp. QY071]
MSDTHTVALARKAKKDDVVSAARDLVEAASTGSVDLDLSELSDIDATWGAVLSNVLVSLREARNLMVHMPSAPRAHTQLARSGMYFALARHPGFDWQQDLHGWNDHLARWRRDWRPADLQDPLFDLAGEWVAREEPNPFDDQLVAFLNPDRTPREDAPNDQAAVVYPWLRHLMRHDGEVDPSEELDLHRKISLVTWELLDNIREHAHLSRAGQSSLATFATKGRPNHLNLYVMDTGVGIPASLRSRLGDDPGSDTDSVAAALNGELALRGRSRGNGLRRIVSLVESMPGASMFLASGPTTSRGSVVAELSGGSKASKAVDAHTDARVRAREVPVSMQGTVVVVKLPFGIGRNAPVSIRRSRKTRNGRLDARQLGLPDSLTGSAARTESGTDG